MVFIRDDDHFRLVRQHTALRRQLRTNPNRLTGIRGLIIHIIRLSKICSLLIHNIICDGELQIDIIPVNSDFLRFSHSFLVIGIAFIFCRHIIGFGCIRQFDSAGSRIRIGNGTGRG